jgi:hypothetical protein
MSTSDPTLPFLKDMFYTSYVFLVASYMSSISENSFNA